ncbi:MAG: hypothetical protein GX606_06450 [Elusimicrobia bacterium]|nr:hypothetical protein [Elusimicrobiota bacterium]
MRGVLWAIFLLSGWCLGCGLSFAGESDPSDGWGDVRSGYEIPAISTGEAEVFESAVSGEQPYNGPDGVVGGLPEAAGPVDPMAVLQEAGFTPEMIEAMQQGRIEEALSPEDRAALEQMRGDGGDAAMGEVMDDAGLSADLQEALVESARRNQPLDPQMQRKLQDTMWQRAQQGQ